MGTPPLEDPMPPDHNLPPHMQNQPNYSHIRHAPSASPPVNGVPFHHRQSTPQPQMGSRPASRNNMRRPSSNLAPPHLQQAGQAPPGSDGYPYPQNQPVYTSHPTNSLSVAPHHAPQPIPSQQYYGQQPPAPPPPPPPSQSQQPPHPQHPQFPQAYMREQRPQSTPPTFQSQERPPPPSIASPPQPERELRPQENQANRLPNPTAGKSRSIFTPIDDSRSLLAQQWGIGTTTSEAKNKIKNEKDSQAHSIDLNSVHRTKPTGPSPPPPRPRGVPALPRTQTASTSGEIQPPSRTNSGKFSAARPRLTVQIPSEQSDGGSATAESSPRQSAGTLGDTPAKASTDASHSSGVVLPPPSPSASAILSAGAQGPPNPFARPHPPLSNATSNHQSYGSNSIETPISALPSRFVADGLLPSPSAFYPEWNFGRSGGDSNMLPSPLNFTTPIMSNGPSFLRDEDGERKRKSPEGDGQESTSMKRVKT